MVFASPIEELQHQERVDHMREADATEDITGTETMSGPEAVRQEMAKVDVLLRQLRGHSGIRRHTYEHLRTQSETLRTKSVRTPEHSAQFVLAGKIRDLSRSMEALLSV
ncbi:MAG: hypothetical protein PHX87_00520 [Candidatus Peribacteraceae bacterium]|nr:hypothetical protein [Candidatus Peribacteraceae bacterium]MDD5741892.1 hypothetical protein [Candidatus Peribacteraceae bacterium]